MRKISENTQKNGLCVSLFYVNGLKSPNNCVSCQNPVSDKKMNFIAYNTFYTNKVILKLPVCDDCYMADNLYIDIKPIIIIGTIVFVLSLFSMAVQPDYIPISRTLFIIGGIVWLLLLTGYLIYSLLRAKNNNDPEIVSRRNDLKQSVKPVKFISHKNKRKGEIILWFKNKKFAREIKKLNNGKFVEHSL